MKTSLLIIILIASFTGCSDEDRFVSPPELRQHVQEFVIQGRLNGVNINTNRLKIKYGHTMPTRFGYCDCSGLQRNIVLDSAYTTMILKYHPERVYALVFHELGHGLLNRGHIEGKSLMNPSYLQTDHWEEFTTELFTIK